MGETCAKPRLPLEQKVPWPETYDELLPAFEAFSAGHLVFDQSRRMFALSTLGNIDHLSKGVLCSNGHCCLLLGQTGDEKTQLLLQLGRFATNAPNVLLVFLTGSQQEVERPSDAIAKLLGKRMDRDRSGRRVIMRVITLLEQANKFVFLVVDDLQEIFKSSSEEAQALIDELSEIGDTTAGRIHCVIAGSSAELRQLCFAKMKLSDEYPAYMRIDLNNTKFNPVCLSPLAEQAHTLHHV